MVVAVTKTRSGNVSASLIGRVLFTMGRIELTVDKAGFFMLILSDYAHCKAIPCSVRRIGCLWKSSASTGPPKGYGGGFSTDDAALGLSE